MSLAMTTNHGGSFQDINATNAINPNQKTLKVS